MGLYIGMLAVNLIIPVTMLISGAFMYKNPLGKPNAYAGYRSRRSRMNQDTWNFAQEYCGKLWIRAGAVLMALAVIIQLIFINAGDEALANYTLACVSVECVAMLATIWPVEFALKRTFDENGNRREVR